MSIRDFDYQLPERVPAGASIEVANEDDVVHTFTSAEGGLGGGVPSGKTARFTAPAEPGEYPVTCYFHSEMKATLVVS